VPLTLDDNNWGSASAKHRLSSNVEPTGSKHAGQAYLGYRGLRRRFERSNPWDIISGEPLPSQMFYFEGVSSSVTTAGDGVAN
jgi:hypothetical protein